MTREPIDNLEKAIVLWEEDLVDLIRTKIVVFVLVPTPNHFESVMRHLEFNPEITDVRAFHFTHEAGSIEMNKGHERRYVIVGTSQSLSKFISSSEPSSIPYDSFLFIIGECSSPDFSREIKNFIGALKIELNTFIISEHRIYKHDRRRFLEEFIESQLLPEMGDSS